MKVVDENPFCLLKRISPQTLIFFSCSCASREPQGGTSCVLLVPTTNLQDFELNPKLKLGKGESNFILEFLVVPKLEYNKFL